MLHTKHLIYLFILLLSLPSCNSKTNSSSSENEGVNTIVSPDKATVYYFHATRRCATCEAVEKVSKETLAEFYGQDVPFVSINRDENKNEALVKHYKVNGQTLLVVKNKQSINLTNNAFLNARTNPDKLKSKLKETIDSLL